MGWVILVCSWSNLTDLYPFKKQWYQRCFLISMKCTMLNCKIKWIKHTLPHPIFLYIIQEGGHLGLVTCPSGGILVLHGAPPNLTGPPKSLYPSVGSEAVLIYQGTLCKMTHQNQFQICVKIFKYVVKYHSICGNLIIRRFYCTNICLRLTFPQPEGQ